jgi:TolB-like protein/DNA-binding winged helix-turn-helix (wHTH) protein/Tfp pilus assembly protein PilF
MPPPVPSRRLVQFGVFEVDLESAELRKRGMKLKLQDQPFKVLQLLLERPGQIVTKEELRVRVWPENTFVEFDQGLYSVMARLRDALGDSSESPRFIETVARRGYRFIAPIPESLESETTTQAVASLPNETSARRYVLGVLGILLGSALLLAILLGLDVSGAREWFRSRGTSRIRSLAVLPLENLSGDPEQEYLADGMTDELITDLAQLANLRVISRTSVMRYKKTEKSLREIARELNVDAVIEGTVARLGNRVRIRVQLVRTADDRHLWAQAYERELQDIFLLQNDAAHEIADRVGVNVMNSQKEQLADRKSPMKPQAYEAYLRGRFYTRTGRPEDVQKAKANFQQAIRDDPQAALAYAALAGLYIFETYRGTYLGASRKQAAINARSLASKALELNSDLLEAHLAMTGIAEIDWDWAEAEKHYKRALVLEPGSADAHLSYGMFLAAQGRFRQAIPETQIALQLDPVSAETRTSSAFTYYLAGEFDRAIEQGTKALEIDPGFEDAHANLMYSYIQKHMYDEAVQEFGKFAAMWQYSPASVSEIEEAYRRDGIRAFLNKQIELNARGRIPPLTTFDLASLYALLGEKDKALEYLERASEERDPELGFIKVQPELRSLQSESRFQDLVRRMGLSGPSSPF